jgi:isochorismate synthase
LGATPETLLNIEGTSFKTMSLAGTQVDIQNKPLIWKSKELEEQLLVTNFIENQLVDIAVNLNTDKTETVKAGNLLHLRTKVSGDLNNSSSLEELIRALHPTPAVCGLPRELARTFLFENENYDRSFYTGFLGELNLQDSKDTAKSSALFVNLRCMRIQNNKATIFVGGGITKDSNASNEWEETVSKAKTMKRML